MSSNGDASFGLPEDASRDFDGIASLARGREDLHGVIKLAARGLIWANSQLPRRASAGGPAERVESGPVAGTKPNRS